jgi:hypothetical protein
METEEMVVVPLVVATVRVKVPVLEEPFEESE